MIEAEPEPGRKRRKLSPAGRCQLDGELTHAGYSCGSFASAEVSADALGLTRAEVTWCHDHPRHSTARRLADLYRAIIRNPRAPRPRAEFSHALAAWREERRRLRIDLRLPVTHR